MPGLRKLVGKKVGIGATHQHLAACAGKAEIFFVKRQTPVASILHTQVMMIPAVWDELVSSFTRRGQAFEKRALENDVIVTWPPTERVGRARVPHTHPDGHRFRVKRRRTRRSAASLGAVRPPSGQ